MRLKGIPPVGEDLPSNKRGPRRNRTCKQQRNPTYMEHIFWSKSPKLSCKRVQNSNSGRYKWRFKSVAPLWDQYLSAKEQHWDAGREIPEANPQTEFDHEDKSKCSSQKGSSMTFHDHRTSLNLGNRHGTFGEIDVDIQCNDMILNDIA